MGKEPILRDTLNREFKTAIDKAVQEANADKEKGFDINSLESIIKFANALEYTPMYNTVLIKAIKQEEKIGNIIIPDMSNKGHKGVVIVPGMFVTMLKAGDIVNLQSRQSQTLRYFNRIFKEINFWEVDADDICGVFQFRSTIQKRVEQANRDFDTSKI